MQVEMIEPDPELVHWREKLEAKTQRALRLERDDQFRAEAMLAGVCPARTAWLVAGLHHG